MQQSEPTGQKQPTKKAPVKLTKNGKPKVFSKSKLSNLYLHQGGTYYAVIKVDGNKIRRILT